MRLMRALICGFAFSCGCTQGAKAPKGGDATTVEVVELRRQAEPDSAQRVGTKGRVVTETEFYEPPSEVISLLERSGPPDVVFHAHSRQLVRSYPQQLLTRQQVGQPSVPLAGRRIVPGKFALARRMRNTKIRLNSLDTPRDIREIRPPADAYFGDVVFSPGGNKLLIPLIFDEQQTVAVYDMDGGELRMVETPPLSSIWGSPCSWVSEERLLCSAARNLWPPPATVPVPKIQELEQGAAPARTYSNLLRSRRDALLLEHYGAVQLVDVDLTRSFSKKLPISGLITSAKASPDGKYVATTTIGPPYSRLVPAWKFPSKLTVYEASTGVAVHAVAPPRGTLDTGLPLGPHSPIWDPKKDAELAYVERFIEERGVARDAVMVHTAPFVGDPRVVADDLIQVTHLGFTSARSMTFTEQRADRSWRAFRVQNQPTLIATGAPGESLGDPGAALRVHGATGPVLEYKQQFFFVREASSKVHNYKELLRHDGKAKRPRVVWNSPPGEHSVPLGVLRPGSSEILITSESPQEPPGVFVERGRKRRTVGKRPAPHPELEGVRRRPLSFDRADGVQVNATLYLPPGYKRRQTVPTALWIYPRGFSDAAQAQLPLEQYESYYHVAGPSRFALLTQGYALLDLPAVPIVGPVNTGRDDFLPQLIESARAAAAELERLGVSEAGDIYPMGRSYGAFAVANLMAHSSLFSAGIAMSGAYNRTLTPFGFQYESRTFWQNTEAYVNLSPFFFADQVQGSLLLVHGELDENAGTPAIQSERFFAALVGNGVRARYVALPLEGHQYRGRDAVLHVAEEMLRWLEGARARRKAASPDQAPARVEPTKQPSRARSLPWKFR